jgi:hypothetical protein
VRRLIIGVVAGGVTDIALTNILAVPIVIYVMLTAGILNLPRAQQSAAAVAALHSSAAFYAVSFCVGAACSIAGGYVAAWIAREREPDAGAFSSFLCVGTGVYAVATGKSTDPLWVTLLLVLLNPVLGAAGGRLRRMRRTRAVRAA